MDALAVRPKEIPQLGEVWKRRDGTSKLPRLCVVVETSWKTNGEDLEDTAEIILRPYDKKKGKPVIYSKKLPKISLRELKNTFVSTGNYVRRQ